MNYQELAAKKADLERQAAELEKQIKEAMQAERAERSGNRHDAVLLQDSAERQHWKIEGMRRLYKCL